MAINGNFHEKLSVLRDSFLLNFKESLIYAIINWVWAATNYFMESYVNSTKIPET